MAKGKDEAPRKRFSKSGHTTHHPREAPAAQPWTDPPPLESPPPLQPPPPQHRPPLHRPTRQYGVPADQIYDVDHRGYEDPAESFTERLPNFRADQDVDIDRRPEQRPGYGRPTYHRPPERRYDDEYSDRYPEFPGRRDERYVDNRTVVEPRYDRRDDDRYYGDDRFGDTRVDRPVAPAPTTAAGAPTQTVGRAAMGLGRATISGTNRAARTITRKVITASKSDGAEESGLTSLIWNQVLSYGTDAMVTVALAGTVFFGASANAQRGNVLLYLLVTMAPFAVVAPVIGPALDRLQHGRRWTMAGTAIGRAILALVMAAHPTELLVLYPCALGSLVLSKAYGVVRAAAAPRLVPPGMTLTEANAKLTIFGLASTVVLGGLVGIIIKVTGSYTLGLIITAIGFAACGYFAFRLPKQVDSVAAAPRHPEEPIRPRRQANVPRFDRIQGWARRGFDPHLVIALQGESVLRLLSSMFTIYLAFYVESTSHGLTAALELGGVVGAAGAGNFVGTAIGTRLKMAAPEAVIIASTGVAALACVVGAILFSVLVACLAMLVCAIANALGKIALDALIQKDVPETLRSSAFARSETFLQLAWVLGAALGVAIPSANGTDGTIALSVAAVITTAAAAVVVLRHRAMNRVTAAPYRPDSAPAGGSVIPRSMD